jgi:hypothetical protein
LNPQQANAVSGIGNQVEYAVRDVFFEQVVLGRLPVGLAVCDQLEFVLASVLSGPLSRISMTESSSKSGDEKAEPASGPSASSVSARERRSCARYSVGLM